MDDDSKEYNKQIEYVSALFTRVWSLFGWGYGSGERVSSTDTVHLYEPKSGYQMLKRISIL